MSLSQEERDIMVGLELDKADSTFAEHEGADSDTSIKVKNM